MGKRPCEADCSGGAEQINFDLIWFDLINGGNRRRFEKKRFTEMDPSLLEKQQRIKTKEAAEFRGETSPGLLFF